MPTGIIVLARGRLIAEGDAGAIRDDPQGAGGLLRHRQDLREMSTRRGAGGRRQRPG
jgi:hypothetical protein